MIQTHDVLFKKLLRRPAVLRSFFETFLPRVWRFADFSDFSYADKEQLTASGGKRTGDLLIKARFQDQPTAFLIHVEHQAQPRGDLALRMLEYFVLDSRQFSLPVYPVLVLSHPEPAQRITPYRVDFPDRRILDFRFEVVDLARMDGQEYLSLASPAALALAARMKLDPARRLQQTVEFVSRLAPIGLPDDDMEPVGRFFFHYCPLRQAEVLQMREELAKLEPVELREKVMDVTNPFIRLGLIEGREQGRAEGRLEGREEGRRQEAAALVLRLLNRRLRRLTRTQTSAIRELNLERLESLGEALLDFQSPSDLTSWLSKHS